MCEKKIKEQEQRERKRERDEFTVVSLYVRECVRVHVLMGLNRKESTKIYSLHF